MKYIPFQLWFFIQGAIFSQRFRPNFLVLAENALERDILDTWLVIEEFPQYEVSDAGEVRNTRTGRILNQTDNGRDSFMVTFSQEGRRYTRSVRRLVAVAFLGDPMVDDVAIPLDGDYTNNRADNLVWKPMWFAIEMKAQNRKSTPLDHRRIRSVRTGIIYENTLDYAKRNWELERMVWNRAANSEYHPFHPDPIEFVWI